MIVTGTIFALSSGALPSGVGVIRISGTATRSVLRAICGDVPPARTARLRTVRGIDGGAIDRGLILFFAGPASFTGEDMAELHVHGGKAVVSSILRNLGRLDGLRPAEAGEFTRRAFLNGKIDLTGAEALADLISAETEAQRRFALANADGRQAALYQGWRRRILHARAMVEAELDFADEGDVGESPSGAVWADIRRLLQDIESHLASYHRAEIIREGFRVVIVGAPNAGKSSLLNALAAREVAIVTEEAGTTRDPIEVSLDLGGVKVLVTDTAGLRTDAGRVEAIGIERARERAAAADLVLLLVDLADPLTIGDGFGSVPVWKIGAKADLIGDEHALDGYEHVVSVKEGKGLEELVTAISGRVSDAAFTSEVLPSRIRHVHLLERCRDHLIGALQKIGRLELQAEELRLAGDELGQIVGTVDVEELLGTIFSSFCIGK